MRNLIFTLLVLFLSLPLASLPVRAEEAPYILKIYAEDETVPRLAFPVKPGSQLTVSFFHSYDRADFSEHYTVVAPGEFLLTHMTFRSLLNGQGFDLGHYRTRADGSAELADINQHLQEICFRLGSPDLANHHLVVDGRSHRLLDHLPALTLLHLRVDALDAPQERAQAALKALNPRNSHE